MVADESALIDRAFIERCEGSGEVLQRAADDSDVGGVAEVGHEGGLDRLLLEVSAEVGSANASAKQLLAGTEEMLGGVVGPLDDEQDVAVFVSDGGMSEEVVAVLVEVSEDDGIGEFFGASVRHAIDPLGELRRISLDGLLDPKQADPFEGGDLELLPTEVPSGQLGVGQTQDVTQFGERLPAFFESADGRGDVFIVLQPVDQACQVPQERCGRPKG